MRALAALIGLALLGAGAFWFLSAPSPTSRFPESAAPPNLAAVKHVSGTLPIRVMRMYE